MEHITTEIDIDASAARAWAVLADLQGVARWIPGISAVEVDGLARVCTFDGGAVQHDEISDFAPDSMSYRYRIRGGPLPLTDNEGSFRVAATGESGSRVAGRRPSPSPRAHQPRRSRRYCVAPTGRWPTTCGD